MRPLLAVDSAGRGRRFLLSPNKIPIGSCAHVKAGRRGYPRGHTDEEELLMRRESRIALTRLRSTLVLTFTTALLVALFAPSPAFAASQSLALPQGTRPRSSGTGAAASRRRLMRPASRPGPATRPAPCTCRRDAVAAGATVAAYRRSIRRGPRSRGTSRARSCPTNGPRRRPKSTRRSPSTTRMETSSTTKR